MLKKIGLVFTMAAVSMLLGLRGSHEIHAEEVENTPDVTSEFAKQSVPNISVPLDQKTRISIVVISQTNGINDGNIVESYFSDNLSFNDVQGWTYQIFMEEGIKESSMFDALITVSSFINGIIDGEEALERLKESTPLNEFKTVEEVQNWINIYFSPYFGKSIQEEELTALMNDPIEIIDNPAYPGDLQVKKPLMYNFVDNNVNVKIHYVFSDGLQAFEDRNLTAYKGAASVTIDSPIIEEYEADQKSIEIDFIQEGLIEYTVTYYKPGEVPQLGAQVIVQYVDENGNELVKPVVLSGNIDEVYTSEQKEIPGYSFKEVQGTTSGVFGEEAQEITYVYSKDPAKGADVIVHYQDELGNKLTEDEILNGNIGEAYITEQKEISGYSFKEVQGGASGVFGEEAQEIIYVYSKDPAKGADVVVHYQDELGNKLTEDEILNGNIGKAYITEQKEISGYSFKEVQGGASGVFGEEAQEITYIYKKNLVISGNEPDIGTTKEIPDISTLAQTSLSAITKEENTHLYNRYQNHFLPSMGEKTSIKPTILGMLLLSGVGAITYHKKRKGSKQKVVDE